jgi:hypothetical protein
MRHALHAILSIAFLMLLARSGFSASPEDLFVDSKHAPRDVKLFLHIADASSLWRELSDRPVAAFVSELLGRGDLAKAWAQLATLTGEEPQTLFNNVLGRRVTVLQRERGDSTQWALISQAEPGTVDRLFQALEPRVLAPRHDVALAQFPDFGLVVGRRDDTLLVGPVGASALFDELVRSIRDLHETPLSDDPAIAAARELGDGQIGVFLRHDAPLGGHSVAVADFSGDRLTLHHAATFVHSPFAAPVTRLTWDFSPLQAFEQHSIVALMEPIDAGGGQIESFCLATLGESLLSPQMRANLGERRMLVLGGSEKLQGDPRLQSIAAARCYEITDDSSAIVQLDEQMIRLTNAINRAGQGAYLVNVPHAAAFRTGAARQIDLQPAAETAFKGLPIMPNIELNWDIASGPSGKWYVIASDREQLLRCKQALASPIEQCMPEGRYEHCGFLNGQKLGLQLQGWTDVAPAIADESQVQQVSAALRLLSELAGGIEKCRWQMIRPATDQVRVNMQIKLAEPQSTRIAEFDSRVGRKQSPTPIHK